MKNKERKPAPSFVGVEELAKAADLGMGDVKRVFSAIVLLIRKHGEVRIRGFGRFTARDYAERTLMLGDEEVHVEARKVLHFNSSKQANKALSAHSGSKS